MRRPPVLLRAVVLLVALGVVAGCSGSDLVLSTGPTTTVIVGPAPLLAPHLAGLTGTAVGTELPDGFLDRLRQVDPMLVDPRFAAQAYDSVIVVALAAELARTDAPSRFASEIVGVTTDGEKCTTYSSCRVLTDTARAGDPDYDGVSGPIEMQAGGDVGEASYDVSQFDPSGKLERLGQRTSRAAPIAADAIVPAVDRLAGPGPDGRLTIGVVLSRQGVASSATQAERAGIKLAVDDVNRADGVLGVPIRLLDSDAGDPGSPTAGAAVARQIGQSADVIIGTSTNDGTAAILGPVTSAGVVLISPSATGTSIGQDDRGLFFRLAPNDSLQGGVLAGAVTADGYLAPVLIVERSVFGQDAAYAVGSGLATAGAAIQAAIPVDPKSIPPDLAAQVAAAGGDSTVFVGSNEATAAMTRALIDAGVSPETSPWYVTDIDPTIGGSP